MTSKRKYIKKEKKEIDKNRDELLLVQLDASCKNEKFQFQFSYHVSGDLKNFNWNCTPSPSREQAAHEKRRREMWNGGMQNREKLLNNWRIWEANKEVREEEEEKVEIEWKNNANCFSGFLQPAAAAEQIQGFWWYGGWLGFWIFKVLNKIWTILK